MQKNAMAHFYFERESVDFAKYPASIILIELRPVTSKLPAAITIFSASELLYSIKGLRQL